MSVPDDNEIMGVKDTPFSHKRVAVGVGRSKKEGLAPLYKVSQQSKN